MFTKIRKLLSSTLLAALLLSALALAFPATSAAAQDPQPPAPAQEPAGEKTITARLEQQFRRLQRAFDAQSTRLDKLDERVENIQVRIAELKEKGKDTTALENALAEFEAQLASARDLHDQAALVIEAREGFDTSGKVTDGKAARDTVREAGRLLEQAHKDLRPALRQLLKALREYFKDNR